MNLDILICTPDSSSERFRKCYNSLIRTTRCMNYELRIFDNRLSTTFSHAREMNKALQIADNMLIVLDDDVILTGNWLEAMLDTATIKTGIVATTEYKTEHSLWRHGWYCDRHGNPKRWCGTILQPQKVPAVSSCCMLINSPLIKSIDHQFRFNTAYLKYYFDIEFCLHCWEHDYSVEVIPEHCIHGGGKAITASGADVKSILYQDKQLFKQTWLDNGRFSALRKQYDYLWPEGIVWKF